MTMNELQERLSATGIPFTHSHWENPPDLPYGVYLTPRTDGFMADNSIYFQTVEVMVELYTKQKDPAREGDVEKVLQDNDLIFDKMETYLSEVGMYQVIYEIEV